MVSFIVIIGSVNPVTTLGAGRAVNLASPRLRHAGATWKKGRQGFSLIELMVVVTIATILMAFAMPGFTGLLQSYRRDGALQQIVGDVRRARSEAIMTGWQYRIFGFNSGASSPYKNQYRVMARSSGAVAWPDNTAAPVQAATQIARGWVDINALYRGVRLNPSDGTADFSVAFDARGVRVELDSSFDPLVIAGETGSSRSVRVSAVGSVRTE